MLRAARTAAIVTVGTELTLGLQHDTNSTEIAAALTAAGFRVEAIHTLPDDRAALASLLERLCALHTLVVVTGGLGPTHDDVTREAASDALSLPLRRDAALEDALRPVAERHAGEQAAAQVYRQADVLEGATVLAPRPGTGTAPGEVVPTTAGRLLLLPGPPSEMRPMLDTVLDTERPGAAPVVLGVVGRLEADVQVAVLDAIAEDPGVGFTVLATPGEVRAVLTDEGAGEAALAAVAGRVQAALGSDCVGRSGLAETVLETARAAGVRIAVAESCTGGMVAARLTDVPGASDVFLGGTVTYSDSAKTALLGVPAETIAAHGAVSEETAIAMAEGVRAALGADLAVSVTGVAGPSGGSGEKPVGLVWFGVAGPHGTRAESRMLHGDRARVRTRAVVSALDLVRRELAGG